MSQQKASLPLDNSKHYVPLVATGSGRSVPGRNPQVSADAHQGICTKDQLVGMLPFFAGGVAINRQQEHAQHEGSLSVACIGCIKSAVALRSCDGLP
jgi:hypothetical protein